MTLWRKTCPDIEEEAATTGSHKNLPINKQCKTTWNDEGYGDEGDDSGDDEDCDEDGDACVIGNEYITSSLPVPGSVYCCQKKDNALTICNTHSSVVKLRTRVGGEVMELRHR